MTQDKFIKLIEIASEFTPIETEAAWLTMYSIFHSASNVKYIPTFVEDQDKQMDVLNYIDALYGFNEKLSKDAESPYGFNAEANTELYNAYNIIATSFCSIQFYSKLIEAHKKLVKAVVSKEPIDNCCDLCIFGKNGNCSKEGQTKCDTFAKEHGHEDERILNYGDIYFTEGEGIEYI